MIVVAPPASSPAVVRASPPAPSKILGSLAGCPGRSSANMNTYLGCPILKS
jgi:hypothetical protein